jgi:hypothetical protein
MIKAINITTYLFIFIFFACTKKVDTPGITNASPLHYEEKFDKDSQIDLPANAIGNENYLLVDFYDNCSVKQNVIGEYYGEYSGHGITLRSNQQVLNSEASFSIKYIQLCPTSTVTCTLHHSNIKPYKAMLGPDGLVDCNAKWEIVPVNSYQIDSLNRVITFHETQLNCIYFLARKL